jgi:hypothetical protein
MVSVLKRSKQMTNRWNTTMTAEQLDAYYAQTYALDARFAAAERRFWETRTVAQLKSLKAGAWDACEGDTYQLARSYLKLAEVGA